MNNNEKYLVIINPNAGGRKAEKDWNEIEKILQKQDFEFDKMITKYRHHAIGLVADKISNENYRNIIVVGGDGTVNEVVNGIFLQDIVSTNEITLGMITIGTGNDWGRMYNIPTKYSDAIKKNRLAKLI